MDSDCRIAGHYLLKKYSMIGLNQPSLMAALSGGNMEWDSEKKTFHAAEFTSTNV